MIDAAATVLVVTALLAYVNHRFIGLPSTIGVMAIALLLSLAAFALDLVGFGAMRAYGAGFVHSIDFSRVLMQGMLSLLLFAGALHVDLSALKALRWPVGILALIATIVSSALVGFALYCVLPWLGLQLSPVYCLLFGALISPTDPIAVMGVMKSAGAPHRLETVITGESLFNDGVGVVVFTMVLGATTPGTSPDVLAAATLFAREAIGGVLFGLALGYVTYRLLKSIDSYQEEVLLTLAAVLGGYALASWLHVSGPLAMVVAGLIVGNHARASAMSDRTRQHVDMFWELLDTILNWVLFVLLGLEAMTIPLDAYLLGAALIVAAITIAARWFSVAVPMRALRSLFDLPRGSMQVLVWGGLRGGISVALALSLPPGPDRELILGFTYVVVAFSILVQGLSIGWVVRAWVTKGEES